ncbi:MAG: tRNA (guanosine(46)-N7)-methyltransferase TrmB [Defluviitaleaceae bacterium]|nr:tRNA (guanosine(46)-N7)-methyltransferase TrmB [Defluviitaleaceae bacterium]
MRIRKKVWAERERAENPMYIANPRECKGRWREIFGNDNPVHLEIGCGKGKFIVENALRYPDINFVAMEKYSKIMSMALRRARLAGHLPNLFIFCDDAEDIADVFAEGELSRIYLNFSDPWRDRARWHKRRLTHRGFLARYEGIMATKEAFFKTDNVLLFDFSLKEFEEAGWELSNVTRDLHGSGFEGNIMTEYEERFSAAGIGICRLEARK